MYRLLICILLITHLSHIRAQNLIQNESFEEVTNCPPGIGNGSTSYISYADSWEYFMRTPDFFHSCGAEDASVPINFFGDQEPATGNAYAGFIAYIELLQNLREGIITELSSPLVIGETYYCSFKISLADRSEIACNNIGMLFTTELNQISFSQSESDLGNFSHIFEPQVIVNKAGWTSVSGSFVADSSYQYVSILNNYTDVNTEVMEVPVSGDIIPGTAYYFVDDVCVSSNPSDCQIATTIREINKGLALKVYPTITHSEINIEFLSLNEKIEIEIYNIGGGLITSLSFENTDKLKVNLDNITPGVYLLRIKSKDKSATELIFKQ
ncbi:MAG: T9SS type A sorting domain-containing protein [Saprospiraceae bacterium]|nr:T9SS type A sorting domain-containing protein [Saprospiraceae bacterium]